MDIKKLHTYVSHTYHIDDGPVVDTQPGYLTQGKFKADYFSVTYHDGVLEKVYIKGPQITVKGVLGKSTRARTYFGDFPDWVIEHIDKEFKGS